jgi:hypothetical protein
LGRKKDTGLRLSNENDYGTSFKGLFRNYSSDKGTRNVRSSANKQSTPGWLKNIVNIKDDQYRQGKFFYNDGSIEEGEFTKDGKLINGWIWEL